jgi:hypothetical protein
MTNDPAPLARVKCIEAACPVALNDPTAALNASAAVPSAENGAVLKGRPENIGYAIS